VVEELLAEAPLANIENAAVENKRVAFCKTPVRVRNYGQVNVQQRNVRRDKRVFGHDNDLETHGLPAGNHKLDEVACLPEAIRRVRQDCERVTIRAHERGPSLASLSSTKVGQRSPSSYDGVATCITRKPAAMKNSQYWARVGKV